MATCKSRADASCALSANPSICVSLMDTPVWVMVGGPHVRPAHPVAEFYADSMAMVAALASSALGTRTVKTPFSYRATASAVVVRTGKGTRR